MSNERYITQPHIFLDAKGATGAGTALRVTDFQHISVFIGTDGGADAALTVKCQGALGDTEPTWASDQSVANPWDFVAMHDYQNSEITDGDDGFVVATADDYRQFVVSVDALDWVNFRVTARSAGEVTVRGRAYSNL